MGTSREHPRIGDIVIEGDDVGEIALRPLEDCVVRSAVQSNVVDVPHLPMRLPLSRELTHNERNVLIEQNSENQLAMT